VCRSLVYLWLRLARAGQLPVTEPPANSFVPVRIGPPPHPVSAECPPGPQIARPGSARPRASAVEVRLGNGRTIKIDANIDPAALVRLVAALDGGVP
jgi:hypothetical protein